MKKIIFPLALLLSACTQAPRQPLPLDPASPDLLYTQPAPRSEAGIPIGNGRTGTLLWTTPAALHTQINRVDLFAVNRDTTSFPQRHTDYCGGCAFADIDVHSPAFTSPAFRQSLSTQSGLATTTGDGITVRALASMNADLFSFEITDSRKSPQPITLSLRTLRPALVKTFRHTAASTAGVTDNNLLGLEQHFSEGEYYDASFVAARVVGRSAKAARPSNTEVQLTTPAQNGTFTIYLSSAASFNQHSQLAATAFSLLRGADPFPALLAANTTWWQTFWSKSSLHLHSSDGIADRLAANYNYYLYLMASTSRGDYPTKFNGMLWTTGGDTRNWGIQYWGANQSCLYNTALLAANHADLTDPMFNMYTSMLPSLEQAAREQWGGAGAFIPETVAFDGLAPLPPAIASEMRGLYLMQKPWPSMSPAFHDYAAQRLAYSSRWNWIGPGKWLDDAHTHWSITERSPSPFGPVTHTFARGAKIAFEAYTRYLYTQDKDFLRTSAYPFLRDAAEFYRHFPNLTKDSDGLYHLHHINDNEALWDGTDTAEELSAMTALFPLAIHAAQLLDTDPDLVATWQEISAHLPPLVTSADPREHSTRTGTPVWVKSLPPALHGRPNALPDTNTLPQWFFHLCTLESPPAMQATANATFDAFFKPDPDRTLEELRTAATRPATTLPAALQGRRDVGPRIRISVLSKLPLAAALLGRADYVQTFLRIQSFSAETPVLPNRMDLREGPQTTSAQRLGNAADALTTALLQSFSATPDQPPTMRLLSAWPKSWDADFTLLAPGNFLVTASYHHATLAPLHILSQSGTTLHLHNPFPTAPTVTLNGQTLPITPDHDNILTISTHSNDRLTIAP